MKAKEDYVLQRPTASPFSAHLLAQLNMALVTVTHSTSQAKECVAFLFASLESLLGFVSLDSPAACSWCLLDD